MRTSRILVLLGVLAVAPAAKAADANVVEAEAPSAAAPTEPAPDALRWFGLMVDAGVPDFMQGSIVLRPEKWLRASVGGGYNMISKGVRGGLSILPFGRGPSATVEVGHFFEGDANATA